MNIVVTKIDNKFTLLNNESGVLDYTITLDNSCDESPYVRTGTFLDNNEQQPISLPYDGTFTLVVTLGSDTDTFILRNYPRLFNSILSDVETTLCNCKTCSTCPGETPDCNKLMSLYFKITAYRFNTRNVSTEDYLPVLLQANKCLVSAEVLCTLDTEEIKGDSLYPHKMMINLIAMDYLAMYFSDYYATTTPEQITIIDNQYKKSKIFQCIRKLGIIIPELEDISMATFTVISEQYVNLPPSAVGNNTITVANRATTVLTLAMFTTNTTPPYADPENNPPENLRVNTISGSNTGLFKYNGVNLTIGQIIPVSGITGGLLTHVSPNVNPQQTDSFTFSLSDTGSHQYTPA